MTEFPRATTRLAAGLLDPERRVWIASVLGALLALAGFVVWAPEYLAGRGFPLDDAWIHATYGRELARSFTLAYNPGVPATGATSPLWAALLALPHLVLQDVTAIVVAIKLLGFTLHVGASVLAGRAISGPSRSPSLEVLGAALVAANPALVAASLSGMEVSLASAFAAALMVSAASARAITYASLCALAAWARPELGCICVAAPVLIQRGRWSARTRQLLVAAGAGLGVSFGLLAVRNFAVSGRPLPATFYAKVGTLAYPWLKAQWVGFTALLDQLPMGSPILLVVLLVLALWALLGRRADAPRRAAATFLAGIVFCAVSFALIPPIDPEVFYHQRYPMPALALLLAPAPALLWWALGIRLEARSRRVAAGALLGLAVVVYGLDLPGRSIRISNDAHNIDDVQVALGRSLSTRSAEDVFWAVDAGGVRYFGKPFVVDMLGLNTPEMLTPDAQRFLSEHRPRFIEVVPGWSRLDPRVARVLPETHFEPSTRYTVTNFPPMQVHFVFSCERSESGQYSIRGRVFDFSCPVRPR